MLLALLTLFAEGEEKAAGSNPLGSLPMILLIMVAGFFILILPMRRQKKQQEQLMSGVKRNDKVITAAGIIGVVVDVREKKDDDIKEDELIIRVDENSNTRMRILKSSIARVFPAQVAGSDSPPEKK